MTSSQLQKFIETVVFAWVVIMILGLMFCGPAYGQTAGAILPNVKPQFLDNNGLIASGGKLCTYDAGTSNFRATYSDSGLTTPNANPVVLDASGRPTSGAVYLSGVTYKFVLYTAGNDPLTCPGGGSLLWSQDNIGDIGQILKANLAAAAGSALVGFQALGANALTTETVQSKLQVYREAVDYQGATADVKITRAIAALPATGGTVTTLGLTGAQSWAACPTFGTGVTRLVLTSGQYALAVNCTIPANIVLDIGGGATLTPAGGTTLTVTGSIVADPTQQIFDLASGTLVFTNGLPKLSVKWFGAKGDNSTADDARIQQAYTSSLGTYSAFQNNCSSLYFPPGKYKVSAAIVLEVKGGSSGCPFLGDGPTTSQLIYSGTGDVFHHDESTDGSLQNWGMEGLGMVGPGSSSTARCVYEKGTGGTGIWLFRNSLCRGFGTYRRIEGTAAADLNTEVDMTVNQTKVLFSLDNAQSVNNIILGGNYTTGSDAASDLFFFDTNAASNWGVHGAYMATISSTGNILHYAAGFLGGTSGNNFGVTDGHIELIGGLATTSQLIKDESSGQNPHEISFVNVSMSENALTHRLIGNLRGTSNLTLIGGNLPPANDAGQVDTIQLDTFAGIQTGATSTWAPIVTALGTYQAQSSAFVIHCVGGGCTAIDNPTIFACGVGNRSPVPGFGSPPFACQLPVQSQIWPMYINGIPGASVIDQFSGPVLGDGTDQGLVVSFIDVTYQVSSPTACGTAPTITVTEGFNPVVLTVTQGQQRSVSTFSPQFYTKASVLTLTYNPGAGCAGGSTPQIKVYYHTGTI